MEQPEQVYSPGDVANRLGISGAGVRRLARIYEEVFGELPRDSKGRGMERPRVWTGEAVERIERARALVRAGRAGSIEAALRLPDDEDVPDPYQVVPRPSQADFTALVEELRGVRAAVERQNALLEEQGRRLAALEAPGTHERSLGPHQTATEEPDPEHGSEGGPEATEQAAARPVDRLPLAWWILGGALSVVAYPLALYLQIATQDLLPVLLLVIPGVFGYTVGANLPKLRFWRHIAPISVLLIAGGLIGYVLRDLYRLELWLRAEQGFSFDSFLWVFSSAALYSFAALLGNARQRSQTANLIGDRSSGAADSDAPARGWTPQRQALVAVIGTVISLISALVGLIGAIFNATSGNGG